MYSEPETWQQLMDKLGDMVIAYLRAQIAHGAKAVQLFDSWVGALSARDFNTYVYPTIKRIFKELAPEKASKIYFPGVSSGELLPLLHDLETNVIGLDWRVSIREGRRRIGERFAIQGNLDPMVLNAPWEIIKDYAAEIIDQ